MNLRCINWRCGKGSIKMGVGARIVGLENAEVTCSSCGAEMKQADEVTPVSLDDIVAEFKLDE